MHSPNLGFRSKFAVLSLALTMVALWLVLRGYHGLTGDGQIYAFQALAKLHPQLVTDLYLQNTSQDQYTVFSPFYAWFIDLVGLENAARLLTLVFTLWFLTAAWDLVRIVAGLEAAWAAVAFLLIAEGNFGGSGVFRILEPFLTARLPAEALIVTALALDLRGMRWIGLSLALGAMVIHPLMAFPGLLVLACRRAPIRVGVIGAVSSIFATLAISVFSVNLTAISRPLTIMDAAWLEVVRERSQFLFLQLWSWRDWEANAQPFFSLGLTAIAVPDDRIRKLCAAAALVGAAGLAVALIGGLIGPVAILVQGQAWRWVWITVLVSAVLLPFTVLEVVRDVRCGPLCALLLISGWTLPGISGTACIGLAMIIWSARMQFNSSAAAYFRWLFAALGTAIGVWIFIKYWTTLSPPTPSSGLASSSAALMQDLFALKMPAVLLGALIWWELRTARAKWRLALLPAALAAFAALMLPPAFRQPRALGSPADIHEFADWANVIPPSSTVLVSPPRDVGAFVWFTLDRTNYLALDQSAGVVFSRTTALEVLRRSEVLLPLMDPDWKLLTRFRVPPGTRPQNRGTARSLTSEKLIQVCADPQLGFVISPEKIGFDPLSHKRAGPWKDWNLYDCGKVRKSEMGHPRFLAPRGAFHGDAACTLQ